MSKAYIEKLRDPRWQKKRLKILERDEWSCQICGDSTSTLHVHHRRYLRGKDPWDYDDALLTTLCEECHEYETDRWPDTAQDLIEALKERFFASDIDEITMGIRDMPLPAPHKSSEISHAYRLAFCKEEMMGVIMHWYSVQVNNKRIDEQCALSYWERH